MLSVGQFVVVSGLPGSGKSTLAKQLAPAWHALGFRTPTSWLTKLSDRVVNVHCECSAEVAPERFVHRKRHIGHQDDQRLPSEVLASIRAVAQLGRLDIGPRVDVDTAQTSQLDALLSAVRKALNTLGRERFNGR